MTIGAIILGAVALIGIGVMVGLGIWAILSDSKYLH